MEYKDKIERIKQAMTGKRYASRPVTERIDGICDVLRKHYRRKRQAADMESIISTAEQLDEDIRTFYGNTLYFGEVSLAIDWGMYGEYGEFTGMNADRLFRFIRSYIESPERAEAARFLRIMSSAPAGHLSGADIGRKNWEAMFEYAHQAYREYCRLGFLPGTRRQKHGLPRALQVCQRNNEANTYKWLKTVGIVSTDAQTLGAEIDMKRRAENILTKDAADGDLPYNAGVMAGAMMLEAFFRTAKTTGFDFLAAMEDVSRTPEDERRAY